MTDDIVYDDTFSLAITSPATGFLWEVHAEGQGWYEVSGTCPRCRCTMVKVWRYGQYAHKGPSRSPDTAWYTRCTCPRRHAGRPEEEPGGCGAGLWIALPPGGLPTPTPS